MQNHEKKKEKGKRKQKCINSKYKNSSGDSGISDDGALYFSDSDMPSREGHLTKLQLMAKSLEQNFPAGSTPMLLINHALGTSFSRVTRFPKILQKLKITEKKTKVNE